MTVLCCTVWYLVSIHTGRERKNLSALEDRRMVFLGQVQWLFLLTTGAGKLKL